MKYYRWLEAAALALCLAVLCVFTTLAQRPQLYSKQEPIWLDFDMENIKKPATYETGYLYDFTNNTFFKPFQNGFGIARKSVEAINVNTLDEVPDSSWFTNRNGRRALSLEEIKRGPNETDGPAPGTLTVVKGKSNGITPGFQIKDSRGDIYLLKFDPVGYPEMSSAAEAIATRLFYAIGYNVPQNIQRQLLPMVSAKNDHSPKLILTRFCSSRPVIRMASIARSPVSFSRANPLAISPLQACAKMTRMTSFPTSIAAICGHCGCLARG
jgi:hypothetical protein